MIRRRTALERLVEIDTQDRVEKATGSAKKSGTARKTKSTKAQSIKNVSGKSKDENGLTKGTGKASGPKPVSSAAAKK